MAQGSEHWELRELDSHPYCLSGNSVEQWFRGLPPVTRWHFATCVIVTLAGNFGLVNPVSIALLQEQIFKKFEVR